MITVTPMAIADVKLIELARHGDARGFFSETWNKRDLEAHDLELDFVQDNLAFSAMAGTLRGLHFQIAPAEIGKLVSAVRGSVLDVALDIRRSSPTYGQHVAVRLSADEGNQVWVPPGFAHGYCTLEPESVVFYKQTDYYAPKLERGIRWDDPALAIEWPVDADEVFVSERDAGLPSFEEYEKTS